MSLEPTKIENELKPEQETIFSDMTSDFTPYQKNLKNARIWLFVLAGIHFCYGIYQFSISGAYDYTIRWINFAIYGSQTLAFLAFAIWSYKKPKISFLTALIFYIAINVLFMVLEPWSIINGWVIKILVVVALFRGYNDAKEFEEMKALNGN